MLRILQMCQYILPAFYHLINICIPKDQQNDFSSTYPNQHAKCVHDTREEGTTTTGCRRMALFSSNLSIISFPSNIIIDYIFDSLLELWTPS